MAPSTTRKASSGSDSASRSSQKSTGRARSGSGGKSGQGGSRSGRGGRSVAGGKSAARHESFGSLLLSLLTMTFFGRLLLILAAVSLVVLLTLFLTGDRYQVFFMAIGVELLAVLFIAWLRFMLKKDAR